MSIVRFLAGLTWVSLSTTACGRSSTQPPPAASGSSPAPAEARPASDWGNLRPSPVKRGSLSPALVERIRALQLTFAAVDPSSPEQWVEDFSRDAHPEREIEIYEAMAKAYSPYCEGKTLSQAAKSDVYQVLLARSGAPNDEVIAGLELKALSRDEARDVARLYTLPPRPIQIIPATK